MLCKAGRTLLRASCGRDFIREAAWHHAWLRSELLPGADLSTSCLTYCVGSTRSAAPR